MDRISDRHEGTLNGVLAPVDAVRPVTVAIELPADAAALPACQHTVWMLVNLLARQDRIIERVTLRCPPRTAIAGRIVPLAPGERDLTRALLTGAAAIGGVPVVGTREEEDDDIRLIVGPGEAIDGALRVHGERWWGGIAHGAIDGTHPDSLLPYGPYAAACLAVAEIFKGVRLAEPVPPTPDAFYSTWSLRAMDTVPTSIEDVGPHRLEGVRMDATPAGGGAVGSTWLHAVWATEGLDGQILVADADELGVDITNLNRCPLFGRASIDKPKATEAAAICADTPLSFVPFDGPVGDATDRPDLLISAVDTNTSRRAVQGLYPARLVAASTHNLRAEVLRCDPSAGAPCISCFNPPEADVPDADLRRQYLAAGPDERERLATRVGLSVAEADRWAVEGTCSYATDRLLALLREDHRGPAAFAVGFVSVMAGTMLAAQAIREIIGDRQLNGTKCRAVMQFLDLTAKTNTTGHRIRDAECPMCNPADLRQRICGGR